MTSTSDAGWAGGEGRQFFERDAGQVLLPQAVEELPLRLAAFVFEDRLAFDRRPLQLPQVAQLEAARAVEVVLQGGLGEGEGEMECHDSYTISSTSAYNSGKAFCLKRNFVP